MTAEHLTRHLLLLFCLLVVLWMGPVLGETAGATHGPAQISPLSLLASPPTQENEAPLQEEVPQTAEGEPAGQPVGVPLGEPLEAQVSLWLVGAVLAGLVSLVVVVALQRRG